MSDWNSKLHDATQFELELRAAHTLDEVCDCLYQHLCQLMPVDFFFLALYAPNTGLLHITYLIDEGVRYPPSTANVDELVWWAPAIKSRKPVRIHRTPEEIAQGAEALGAAMLGNETRLSASMLFGPLMRGDEIIGALSVQSYQFDAYTDEHLQMLEQICEQVVLTLDNLRLRELMRTSQEMYQILFNATPLSVAIASLETGAFVDANETCVKMLRYSDASEMLGRHILDFVAPECREDVRRCIENLAEGRPVPQRYEVRLLCKDGSTIDSELNIADCELLSTRYLVLVACNISERAARERELRHHIALLRAFQETLSKLARAGSLSEALNAIGEAAMRLLEADRAAIYEVAHHPRKMVRCLWSRGLSDEYIHFIEQYAPIVPGRKALDMKQPRFITDVYSHPEMAILREHVKREGYHSIGIFPLVMRNEAIGALALYYDTPRRLSRHEFETGQAFADQLAVALHSARLYEDAVRRAEFLAARSAVMGSLLTSLSFEEIAVTLFDSIRQLMPCDYISVALLDPSAQRMEIIASWSTDGDAELNEGSQLHAPVTWIDSLSLQSHRYYPDLKERAHIECEVARVLLRAGMRACANIPIVAHGKVIGVLTVSSVMPDAFTGIHIEQLREFAHLIGIALQRAQLYDRLERSEALYRDLYDNAPVGYHTVDAAGIITDMNRTELEWLGYRPEEIIGKMEFRELLTPDSQRRWHMAWQTAWQRGVAEAECEMTRRDGSTFPIRLYMRSLWHGQQEPSCMRIVVMDITTEKNLERQLMQAQKMQSLGTLAGGIAHDFNNLLQGIIGYTELALDDVPEGTPLHETLTQINALGKRAAHLTTQLLTFSRQAPMARQTLDMVPLVKETVKMLQRTIPENIRIELVLDTDHAMVEADPTQAQQIITNLAVNARDAMPNGGKLTIQLSVVELDEQYTAQHPDARIGTHVCLVIRDTGIGMSEEIMERIFEPFFTTKPPGRGTGLGLSTVYGIVRAHDGHITVESQLGKGSEFRVYLPTVRQRIEQQDEIMPPLLRGTETILWVEDDPVVRDVGMRMMEHLGYKVLVAANGKEAIEVWEAHRQQIELVLTDMVMPEMGGVELCEELRRRGATIPILIATGYLLDTDVNMLRSKGVTDLINKPLHRHELSIKLRAVLDKQRNEAS